VRNLLGSFARTSGRAHCAGVEATGRQGRGYATMSLAGVSVTEARTFQGTMQHLIDNRGGSEPESLSPGPRRKTSTGWQRRQRDVKLNTEQAPAHQAGAQRADGGGLKLFWRVFSFVQAAGFMTCGVRFGEV
jgi:hypothetical protein